MRTFSQIKSGQLFVFDQKVYLKHRPQLVPSGGFFNASLQMNLADSVPVAEGDAIKLKGFEGSEVVKLFVVMKNFRLN